MFSPLYIQYAYKTCLYNGYIIRQVFYTYCHVITCSDTQTADVITFVSQSTCMEIQASHSMPRPLLKAKWCNHERGDRHVLQVCDIECHVATHCGLGCIGSKVSKMLVNLVCSN